jgi:DNA-binding PadR family transcriptional regulator
VTALRMTEPRLAILRACTEMTPEGPRIYNHRGEVWDRATKTKVTAVVTYLLTRGLLGATRMDEHEGKTRVRYSPTRNGREWLAKSSTEKEERRG